MNPANLFRMPNVALAVVRSQAEAEAEIPLLLRTDAALRVVVCEPLLGPVDLHGTPSDGDWGLWWQTRGVKSWTDYGWEYDTEAVCGIDWVIVGGESGPHARPMHPDWVRSLRDQCQAAGVPFFFKQWGDNLPFDQVKGNEQREAFSRATIAGKQSYFGARIVGGSQGPMWGETPGVRSVSYASVGKYVAGRLLDGREWNEVPNGAACGAYDPEEVYEAMREAERERAKLLDERGSK